MNYQDVLKKLETGELRSAQKVDGKWQANIEVKQAILEAFKQGKMVQMGEFVDKDTIPAQSFSLERKIRFVPGGSSVRTGSYVAPGVIIMPPSYINIGAYVDEGTMVDSHVLVGSCAQIGKRVHLSAGVQIGGVLEPVGLSPVVIEDDVFVGAQAVIVEGIQILKGAVIAPGVILSKAVPVYDLVQGRVLDKLEPIPERAVVVPGSRPVSEKMQWGHQMNLHMNCAIIVKYRDEKSDASLTLESILR